MDTTRIDATPTGANTHAAASLTTRDDAPEFQLESGLFCQAGQSVSCAIIAPLHYEPRYAYPLVVWLHGPGKQAERELLRIMPTVSLRNYVSAAPRGFSAGARPVDSVIGWPQTSNCVLDSQRRVFETIDAASAKYHVAPHRVFLAGFDEGGTMALRLAMHHPERFAGVISLCGRFPEGERPLRYLSEARRLPVLMTLGRDSETFPPSEATRNLRLFHAAGMSIAMRQYPCGQQLVGEMLRDMDRWMMEQITQGATDCG